MRTFEVTDEQAKLMTHFCNEARRNYETTNDSEVIHDLYESMIRVIIPDYKLDEKYETPIIYYIEPSKRDDSLTISMKRSMMFRPMTVRQTLPLNERFGFTMMFQNMMFEHNSK